MSDVFAVRDSVVASEALAHMIEREWGFPGPVQCHFIKRGVKDTYLVRSTRHKAVLCLWPHGLRSHEEIQDEVMLLGLLKAAGVSVASPVPDKRGESVRSINAPEGNRYMVLFIEAEGNVGDFGEAHLRELGRSLALLHVRSNYIRVPTRRPELDVKGLLDRPLEVLHPVLDGTPEWETIVRIAGVCREALAGLTRTRPEYGFCHGDCGGLNTFIDPSGIYTHFDFDFCGYGWRAYDMAVFLWSRYWNCNWETALEHWQLFLDGYSQIRPASRAELRSIPYFVACREIWLLAHNETQRYRHPRRPGFKHVQGSVRFLREWMENPALALLIPGAKTRDCGVGRDEEPRRCSCLVAHPDSRSILLFQTGGRWELPGAVQRNPTPACKGALARYGIADFEVWPVRFARLSRGETIFECEADNESLPHREHGRWLGEEELAAIHLADPTLVKEILEWFKDFRDAPLGRAPWERRGWWREVIRWIGDQLPEGAAFFVDMTERGKVYSPWNVAVRVCSTEGRLFFKAVRSWNHYEPRLTETLSRLFAGDVAKVVAVDEARGWLLMEEFGRHLNETGESTELLGGALRRFAEFQIESMNHLDEIAATGIPDLRHVELDEVSELLDRADEMLATSGNPRAIESRQDVPKACRVARRAVESAAGFDIPAALVHGDFTWINIALKTVGQGYVFFDWGESCISHPFISAAQFAECCDDWQEVLGSYFDAWSAYGSRERLMEAFEVARLLNKVHYIRGYEKVFGLSEGLAAGYALGSVAEAVRDLASKA